MESLALPLNRDQTIIHTQLSLLMPVRCFWPGGVTSAFKKTPEPEVYHWDCFLASLQCWAQSKEPEWTEQWTGIPICTTSQSKMVCAKERTVQLQKSCLTLRTPTPPYWEGLERTSAERGFFVRHCGQPKPCSSSLKATRKRLKVRSIPTCVRFTVCCAVEI